MTLPFENDTNSFIKKLASAQLKKERLKKIFTIVAISLATFLMASVLLLVSGIITVTKMEVITLRVPIMLLFPA